MIRVAASLTGLTVVLALVLYLTLGDGDSSPTTDTSPSPFVAASPTATLEPIVATSPSPTLTPPPLPTPLPDSVLPAILKGEDVRYSVVTDPIPFPDDLALILEMGCFGCDGPAAGLRRVYKDAEGEIHTEVLLTSRDLDLTPVIAEGPNGPYQIGPTITGLAIAPDGSEMIVGFCVRSTCGGGGLIEWSADARVALFRSVDGGVTWQDFGEEDRGLRVLGYVGESVALVSWYEAELTGLTYALYPSMVEQPAPAGDYLPVLAVDGRIVWGSQNDGTRFLYGDGTVFMDFGSDASAVVAFGRVTSNEFVQFVSYSSLHGEEFLSVLLDDGALGSTVALSHSAYGGVWLDDGRMLTNTFDGILGEHRVDGIRRSGSLPVIIDFGGGTLSPIGEPFLDHTYDPQRDTIRAVQTGPFARIDGTGSCLNLRSSPSLDAAKVDCLADGVLLRHDSVAVTNQDVEWLQVTAPDGTPGWAATEFLEW